MAVTYIGAGSSFAASGDVTPASPTGSTVGDLWMVGVSAVDNVTCSFPIGYTILNATNSGASHRVTVAWKFAQVGEVAPLVTHTGGGGIRVCVTAWRGVDPISPFSVVGTPSANASSTICAANAITPAIDDHVIIIAGNPTFLNLINSWNGTNPTIASRIDSTGASSPEIAFGSADSTTGTVTTGNSVTYAAAAVSVGQLVALKPYVFVYVRPSRLPGILRPA